jgi:hypothetical protein
MLGGEINSIKKEKRFQGRTTIGSCRGWHDLCNQHHHTTAGSEKLEPGARMKGGKAEASKHQGEESQ